MENRKIIHEIKLPKSLTIILGALAFGVCVHVFTPILAPKPSFAELFGGESFSVNLTGGIGCTFGCN